MSRPMSLDEIDQDAADFYTGRSVQALAVGDLETATYFWDAAAFWEGQIIERQQAALAKENRDD